MKDIVIVGAGGFGREVRLMINQINKNDKKYNFLGFYDDAFQKGQLIDSFKILGGVEDLVSIKSKISVIIAIGEPHIKKKVVFLLLKNKLLSFPNIIYPNNTLDEESVSLGIGNIICEGSILTTNIIFKDFIIVNLICSIGHDTIIDSYSSIMPGVNISGEVYIHECVYVGTGAKLINQLEIGSYTVIGAGAVVTKSLPVNCTAVGVPAKIIKVNNNE